MKEAICFLSTLPSIGEWSHSYCDVGNFQYMLFLRAGVLIISFAYCKKESSSLFFVVLIAVVEEIYASLACDWRYMSVQCLLSDVFLAL